MPNKNPKNKNIDSYLDNENVKWFLYNILQKESDKTPEGNVNYGGYNQSAGNSTAFGAGQFIGSTRNEILDEYGVDAWSSDFPEQQKAIIALLDKDGDLDAIAKGNYNSQKRGRWEAFSKDKKALGNQRPEGWGNDYQNLLNNAVYEPDASWGKLSKEMQDEKTKWYTEKYNGLFPSNILAPKYSEEFGSYLYNKPAIVEDVDLSKTKHIVDLEQNPNDPLNPSYLNEMQNFFATGGVNTNKMNKRYYATGGVRPELAKTILGNEGFKAEVYSDLGGTPTIGYGFTKDALTGKDGIPSWKEYWNADGTSTGKTMSKEEADELLEKIIKPYTKQINNYLSSEIIDTLSQEQYDSLVDLTYRNGIGNMKDSGVFKAINDGNLSEASKIIVDSPDLNKIGGKQVNPEDAGYKGIKARNLRASTPFSNLDSGVDPTVDNMAAELGMPTSDVYNNLLVERGEFQKRSDIEQLKELDSEKVYDQTIDDIEGMLNNLFMNDNYQVRGEDAPSTFNTGVKERMDWLSQKVPNIKRVIQPYGGEGERFKVDRKAIKDDIYTILDELGQITDEDGPLSYKDRIYKDPYEYQQPDSGIPESDFISPRFYEYYDRTKKDVDPRFLPQEPIDPELPIRDDSYAGPAISMEDADRLYNENIRRMQAVSNDPSSPDFVGPPEAPVTRMAEPSGNYDNPDVRPKTEDPVDGNMLSKLKGQDYMGLLSDIGGYAARMAPLSRAMRDAGSYDQVRYPRFSPALPTAYTQKRDVGTAFNTARQAAMQQGKLDLGALSALATQQAKSVAGVEENVANERIGLLNQAQQLNNQVTMQEMADTAANKGAAATMKYQALAAMSQMGQGSLREANMRRNDANVKNMFENVFGDEFGSYLKDKYSNA